MQKGEQKKGANASQSKETKRDTKHTEKWLGPREKNRVQGKELKRRDKDAMKCRLASGAKSKKSSRQTNRIPAEQRVKMFKGAAQS